MNQDLSLVGADSISRVYHEFGRLNQLTLWWHWLILASVIFAVLGYVVVIYLRDGSELRRGVAASLLLLRCLAFAAILFTFFNLEKREERQLLKTSRLALLIDTSQSMEIHDGPNTSHSESSRLAQVTKGLVESDLLAALREKHHLSIYRFDQGSIPAEITSLPCTNSLSNNNPTSQPLQQSSFSHSQARSWAIVAGLTMLTSILCVLVYTIFARDSKVVSWFLFSGICLLTLSLLVAATGHLQNPAYGSFALEDADATLDQEPKRDRLPLSPDAGETERKTPPGELLRGQLVAQGSETRLGEALRFLIEKEQGGPIAGIVTFTDGNNTAGLKPEVAAHLAQQAQIPLHMVGLGSAKQLVNVGVADLQVPSRVFPGDDFTITGFIQPHGLQGRSVRVQLYSSPDRPEIDVSLEGELEDEHLVRLLEDGKLSTVRFEVTPRKTGRRIYQLRVKPPPQDQNQRDNQKQSVVRVVQRKNRVLLVAGGPTREYRFVRNSLYRDQHTQVDVYLQTSQPGMSQEANQILFQFPATAGELFEYDAVLAFDVDWNRIERHAVDLLERWVAEKSGGLILVAGPVHTPSWSTSTRGNPRLDTIKALHPVVFYGSSGTAFHLSRVESAQAWPLEFTPEGNSAEFLWLDETFLSSERIWATFPGVYGFFAAKAAKPGAQIYAHFSDPQSSAGSNLPVYLAGHFYGAGRVFYMASGEMWRLRSLDESYFDQFYTKLIRYVSQGRLLRYANRGLLLVKHERYLVGESTRVRAVPSGLQHQPPTQPKVAASLVSPDGKRHVVNLTPGHDSAREGMYTAQITATLQGDYRIELPIPNSSEELLTREVRVRLPDREVERTQRNDATLKHLAQASSGAYHVGMTAILPPGQKSPLVGTIAAQDQISYVPGAADRTFDRALTGWLLTFICGALSLEWLLRRLHRLA